MEASDLQQTTGQTLGGSSRWMRFAFWSSLLLLGLAAFAVSLVFYMPARFLAQQMNLPVKLDQVSGTVWNGSAELGDAHSVTWEAAALPSLRQLAMVVNWRVTGPGTDLAGRIAVPVPPRRDRATLDAVRGRIAWPLIEVALPGLPIACEARADVADLRITLAPGMRRGEGKISAPPAVCTRNDGASPPVPTPALSASLSADADGLVAVVIQTAAPQTPLATARLTNADRIIVTIHAAGAAMVPGMPSSSDSEIELPLTVLMP